MACIKKQNPVFEDKVVRRRGGRKAEGKQVDDLKAKLLKNPNNLKVLVELAMLSIWSGDYYMAKLILSKAMEVNENHAPTLNLMGVISLSHGEDQEAYDFLKKAMSADSGHIPTRVNMAAMFMKYLDEPRAKAVLRSVQPRVKTLDLSTPNIHPSVKDALSQLRIR
jgi:Tfp pilus assembly protein PilF